MNYSTTVYNGTQKRVKELVIDIPENLEATLRPELCIYKVPTTLHQINKAVYSPRVISIGPIHHGDQKLAAMEGQKLIYLKEYCERITKLTGRTQYEVLTDLQSSIMECEEAIRLCYEEIGYLDREEFVKMIMLDAVFIIELFLRHSEEESYENDLVIGRPWLRSAIQRDLILLENQLPFFLLQKVYGTFASSADPCLISDKRDYFENFSNSFKFLKHHVSWHPFALAKGEKVKHLVDLVRSFHVEDSQLQYCRETVKLMYSATNLQQAGVKFKVVENGSLNDIHFDFRKGVLTLPCFEVYDTSECLIRNLMALEQCHYPFKPYICNYFFLMDHLINTAEDVDLLVRNDVVINWLGNNTMVADLVNRLCQGIDEFGSFYSHICRDLNRYYKNRCNHRKATLKLVYFSNYWRGTATVAAGIVVVLALIQTVCSILQLL